VSEKVKIKVIELLYSCTVALPEEAKIKDAYHMLKRQGMCPSSLTLSVAVKAGQGKEEMGMLRVPRLTVS
jgi:hypothetical protein